VQGHERAMKKTAKDLDYILEGWLKEYRDQRVDGGVKAEAVDLATGWNRGGTHITSQVSILTSEHISYPSPKYKS